MHRTITSQGWGSSKRHLLLAVAVLGAAAERDTDHTAGERHKQRMMVPVQLEAKHPSVLAPHVAPGKTNRRCFICPQSDVNQTLWRSTFQTVNWRQQKKHLLQLCKTMEHHRTDQGTRRRRKSSKVKNKEHQNMRMINVKYPVYEENKEPKQKCGIKK